MISKKKYKKKKRNDHAVAINCVSQLSWIVPKGKSQLLCRKQFHETIISEEKFLIKFTKTNELNKFLKVPMAEEAIKCKMYWYL